MGRARILAVVAGAAALVLIAVAVTYAATDSSSAPRVRTVVASPTTTTAPQCIAGAAPGSCNIDEAGEVALKDQPLDAATRAHLASQLVEARTVAMKYPTVADIEHAGWLQAGRFSPQTGAHFINLGAVSGPFNPSNPGSLIYDGVSPTSKIIGVMYLSLSLNPPEGFAGPNDHWHRHTNTCVIYRGPKIVVPFAADSDVTREMCAEVHGDFMHETAWMVHAWVVPGWESPRGVFAHDNPDVLCADGTTKTDQMGFCQGT